MGLDMYLTKRHYVQNWEHNGPERRHEITIKLAGETHPSIKPERIAYVIEQIAYWRKANHIHQWFVNNVQKGVDDCGNYYVDHDQLRELLGIVDQVIADPTQAPKLLPTQSGFFFGGTKYDEYYMKDLVDTKRLLTEALSEPEQFGEFYYHSSW